VQLKNDGNYEGENTNQPGIGSQIGNYPEAFTAARNFPDGHLQGFERSRLRLWGIYDWNAGRFGDVSVSGLLRVESARTFTYGVTNQALTAVQAGILNNAGYPDGPASQTVYFDDRGTGTFAGYGAFDMSVNYNVPVFRTLRPWLKADLFNVFNNQKLIAWNTTVSQNKAAGVDALGLATSFTPGKSFGTATGNTVSNLSLSGIPAYPIAYNGAQAGGRTFRISVGFRF
jgi:hypothetical protein